MHDFSSIFFDPSRIQTVFFSISVLNPAPAAPFQRKLLSMSLYTSSLFLEFIPASPHDTTTSDFHSQLPDFFTLSLLTSSRGETKPYWK